MRPLSTLATRFDRGALQLLLPHRGQNLFVPAVEIDPDGQTARSVTILASQPDTDLDLFLRSDADWDAVWYEPLLAELLALTGAPLVARDLAAGETPVFSMISRLTTAAMPPPTAAIHAQATVVRRRERAVFFLARAEVDGRLVMEAEVAAGIGAMATLSARAPLTAAAQPGEPVDPALFAWKDAALRFIDAIVATADDERRLTARYRYPPGHPFVPGHFPDVPVMMGVALWTAMADAAWLARQRFLPRAPAIRAEACVRRADGVIAADARDLVVVDESGIPRIAATGRIAFRSPVIPGDDLSIDVRVSLADGGPAPA